MDADPVVEGLEFFALAVAVVLAAWAMLSNLAIALVALGCTIVAVAVGCLIVSGFTPPGGSN